MTFRGCGLFGFLVWALVSFAGEAVSSAQNNAASLNRSSFPVGFIFGAASAAYQYEGAVKEGGRGPSIWDTFTHKHPEKIKDRSNGDIAIDFYHRYKEDVRIMKDMGTNAFRLSISWTRILPHGRLSGGVSKEGIRYYNNLIDELLSNDVKPFVTLFHWDAPQKLEDDYNGFLSSNIVDDYRNYVDICFREFGDRVKHWITLNEPTIFCNGYLLGTLAPGRCSSWVGNCSTGNSATEPYIVGHHLLLAHAAAVKLYREKYKASQKGNVGITLTTRWYKPLSSSKSDHAAVQRTLDFSYGWFIDPITRGDYPSSMRSLVGRRLPKFSKEQSEMLKGSFDFIGINYYSTYYAANAPPSNNVRASYLTDARTNTTDVDATQLKYKNIGAILIWTQYEAILHGSRARFLVSASNQETLLYGWQGLKIPYCPCAGFLQAGTFSWIYVYPKGLRELLRYTKERYDNPIIYITENGVPEINNKTLPLDKAVEDNMRLNYHRDHLSWLHTAIREGVDVRGYFAWSFMDNFEWADGYTVRFGLNYVDYKDGLKRYPKKSAIWYKKFLKG